MIIIYPVLWAVFSFESNIHLNLDIQSGWQYLIKGNPYLSQSQLSLFQ
jgi:hypothetical protein